MGNGLIAINQKYYNDITYINPDKYKFKNESVYEASFEDGLQ